MSDTGSGAEGAVAEAPATDLDSIFAELSAEMSAGDENPDNTQTETPDESNTEVGEGDEAEAVTEGSNEDAQRYTVKVDGQEVEVTLDDLLGGYMRQSDYTRKTQTLAEQAKRVEAFEALDQAFQSDPKGTLEALAKSLGVSLVSDAAELPANAPDPNDPIAREVAELRQWRAQMDAREAAREQAARQAAIERELEAVKVTYSDPQLDEDALLKFAIDNQIANLDLAYKAMRWQDPKKTATPPVKDTKLAAKRSAPKVAGGSNRNVGVVPGASDRPSLEEAWRQSWQEFRS